MSLLTSLGITGGSGILGGGMVQGIRIAFKDKKEIEKKYQEEKALSLKLLREAREGYETITDDLGKIMDKLGINHDSPVSLYQR